MFYACFKRMYILTLLNGMLYMSVISISTTELFKICFFLIDSLCDLSIVETRTHDCAPQLGRSGFLVRWGCRLCSTTVQSHWLRSLPEWGHRLFSNQAGPISCASRLLRVTVQLPGYTWSETMLNSWAGPWHGSLPTEAVGCVLQLLDAMAKLPRAVGLDVMPSNWVGLWICFPARVWLENVLNSWYSLVADDPNQTGLPNELPGQTGPPAWLSRSAEPQAGISAQVCLQAGTWCAGIWLLAAISSTQLLCLYLIPNSRVAQISLVFPAWWNLRGLLGSILQLWGSWCLPWVLFLPLEELLALEWQCTGLGSGCCSESKATSLTFLIQFFSISVLRGVLQPPFQVLGSHQ